MALVVKEAYVTHPNGSTKPAGPPQRRKMDRRDFIKWSGLGALGLIMGGCVWSKTTRKINRYYTGPVTDHFDGTYFYNQLKEPDAPFSDLMKWKLLGTPRKWPKHHPSPYPAAVPQATVAKSDLTVTMIGHATMLIQINGLNILTDPIYSQRASPLQRFGPWRHNPPGVAFEDLPKIDVILVTHNHYDHLDLDTLSRLVARDAPKIFTPLGNDTIIFAHSPKADIQVGDWSDHFALTPEVKLHFEPCHHWSARGTRDRRMALWAAFVIETPIQKIYYIGDTGFAQGNTYRQAAAKHDGFDLAILPIGAYEPRWFMKSNHQNPAEAVAGRALCNSRYALGHHWGTFQLTDEAAGAPQKALAEALSAQAVPSERFLALHPGQVWRLPT